jgi:hypothetical protein
MPFAGEHSSGERHQNKCLGRVTQSRAKEAAGSSADRRDLRAKRVWADDSLRGWISAKLSSEADERNATTSAIAEVGRLDPG